MAKRGKRIETFEKREIDGFSYTLIRSNKRRYSVSLSLNAKGELIARASPFIAAQRVDDFVRKSYPKIMARNPIRMPFDEGGYYLLGKRIEDPNFHLRSEAFRQKVYKEALLSYLKEAFPRLERQMESKPGMSYGVRKMSRALGLYHRKDRSILFSSVLAPYSPFVIDSVIAHELTHDVYLGHGPRFYARLLKGFPLYKEARLQLKNHDYQGNDHLEEQS